MIATCSNSFTAVVGVKHQLTILLLVIHGGVQCSQIIVAVMELDFIINVVAAVDY
jgi:hypothetical protein